MGPLLLRPLLEGGASLVEVEGVRPVPGRTPHERAAPLERLGADLVGGHRLLRCRNLERAWGIARLHLFFEGANPTGTQKDRIAFAQVADALRRGFERVTLASCGNYGAAMALVCAWGGIGCEVLVPESFHSPRLDDIRRIGATLVRTAGTYEDAVDRSRERARAQGSYDANPGGANEALQVRAYASIATEILADLGRVPRTVAVPVSNGTTLAGIHAGFVALGGEGLDGGMPRLVAGSARSANPVIGAFRAGLASCEELDPATLRETVVNEPLINWRAIDGDRALAALYATEGAAFAVGDRALIGAARDVRRLEGLAPLPAATAGLVALRRLHRTHPLTEGDHVVVLTGRAP